MKELAKEHTVILSSHILSEISAVCDTVMIINKGKLVVSDTVENLPKHLKAKNSCKVLVKGTEEKVRQALAIIKEIEKVSFEEKESGFLEIIITTSSEYDVREDLFQACATSGVQIYEMANVSKNLEDIFLELTQENSKDEDEDMFEDEMMEESEEEENASNL